MNILRRAINKIKVEFALSSADRYIKFLRQKGIKIGENCYFINPRTIQIDYTRPCLVEIGRDVRINKGMTIMTHEATSLVFRNIFNDFVACSGRVKIGNNVYFGQHCTVLKGVTIGDNCIIGFGSIVMKDIPSNSVAVGRPAKVICTLEEYYCKRKQKQVDEALVYARCIKEQYGRRPIIEDFWEEFGLFIDGEDADKYPMLPIKEQLGRGYEFWVKNHKKVFDSFDDFLKAAGIE